MVITENGFDQNQPSFDQTDLELIYNNKEVNFQTESELRDWLSQNGINIELADANKGLSKLFDKIEKGEARIVVDEKSGVIFRVARVAKISVDATINKERYPLVELCQIFLNSPIDEELLETQDFAKVSEILETLDIRSAQVRNSLELWETLIESEDAKIGARRGLVEELNYTEEQAALAEMKMDNPVIEYEAPIDWPEIPSILETNKGVAILPEEISKAAYVELEGSDQITIFVATPGAPLIRALLAKIIPDIHYIKKDV